MLLLLALVLNAGAQAVPLLPNNGSVAVVTDGGGNATASTCQADELAFVHGVTSAIQTQLNTKLATGSTVLSFSGMIEAPADKTFVLDQSAAYAYTINTLKIATVSGTASVAIKINGTSVTGISAVSVSSTPATGTASALNAVAIGDKVTLVVSSGSSPVDLSFTLKYTR